MGAKSKELKALKDSFESYTNIKVDDTIEERAYFHWKRLIFNSLDCEELLKISNWIKDTFSQPNLFTHLLPTIHSYGGGIAVTVGVELIKEHIITKI